MSKTSERGIDLVEILERDVYPRLSPQQIYDWPGHGFKQSGDRLRGNPPWGDSKSGSSFAVFADLGFLDAHNSESGDPIKYRYSLRVGGYGYPKGRDWIDTVKELFDLAGVSFPEREWTPEELKIAQRREQRQTVLQVTQQFCQGHLWTAAGVNERMHLTLDRGFTDDSLKEFGIGLYPTVSEVKQHLLEHGIDLEFAKEIGILTQKWEGYMIFPWSTPYGQPLTLYGHQTKEWAKATGKPKKYALFNPKDQGETWLHTKESPFMLNRAIRDRHRELVLVEGITDAAIAQQLGDTRVVACVAAMLSKDQAATLARHGIERVIIALDPDQAGDEGIESCIKSLLANSVTPYVAPRLPELDPDEFILRYGVEEWIANTKKAIHGHRWKARRIVGSADLTSDIQRESATKEALEYAKSQQDQVAIEQYFYPNISELGINSLSLSGKVERSLSEFDQAIKRLTEVEAITSKAQQFYYMSQLRRELNLSDRELKTLWGLSKQEEKPFAPICVHKLLGEKIEARKWLIPRFIPCGAMLVWYANGGTGKSLLAYDALRAVASGQSWLGMQCRNQSKCLIIQTEEALLDTQERLIYQGYLEETPENSVFYTDNFTFHRLDELADFVARNQIKLIMIDSLTTANQGSNVDEKDSAYANALVELKNKIINPHECTVILIHHENRNEGIRGTTAIANTVDYVVRLYRGEEGKFDSKERILATEKARGGVLYSVVLKLDTYTYKWEFTGEVDSFGNKKILDDRLPSTIYQFLLENPDKRFTAKELGDIFAENYPFNTVRDAVETLKRIGEIGGAYKRVALNDGRKFGCWEYFTFGELTHDKRTSTSEQIPPAPVVAITPVSSFTYNPEDVEDEF